MKSGLIGYTGFVGGNLAKQYKFSELYNSKNINEIDNQSFDLVVCAGARAEKWRINLEPEKDLDEISSLIEHLKTIKTEKFVLISTVDVYKNPSNVNEDSELEFDGLHGYGLNRLHLEKFVQENFNATIIRLPGLFATGLKKNIIYDFLNNNNLEKIHFAGSYQYYNLDYLWKDINLALDNDLKTVNIATEPVLTSEIATRCFGYEKFDNAPDGVIAGSYDMHSKYASIFGGKGNYLYTKQHELDDIKKLVISERSK